LAGRRPLNLAFEKPPESRAAKRFTCNDQNAASFCSRKNCFWNTGGVMAVWNLDSDEAS